MTKKMIRWGTPKQIQIEREGESRDSRRGSLKKSERKKGQKARIDELLSLKANLEREATWIRRAKARKQGADDMLLKWSSDAFDHYRSLQDSLIKNALKDNVIQPGDVSIYMVAKP